MRHYILYYHGGSSNHGCEALVRTTAELLDYMNNKITLASFRPDDDKKYRIDKFCDIHKMFEIKDVRRWNLKWIKAYFDFKFGNKPNAIDDLLMLEALGAKKGDVALSIGGDNYCYNDTEGLIRANELFRRNGIKTVLWGCSIEPELLEDPVIAYDISRFDLITARESISYEAIKKVNKNTILVADSAFNLKTVKNALPDELYNNDIIGLNISPLAERCEHIKGITRQNVFSLIEYILKKSNMNILLIPHVEWSHDNDNVINREIFEKYRNTNRVYLISGGNCEELKGYIAQCRFFVGARTHATIAAYSSCIPTLVIGYSVKSRGIAKDLFNDYAHFVVPVQDLESKDTLVSDFKWLYNHENQIKSILENRMYKYKLDLSKLSQQIDRL